MIYLVNEQTGESIHAAEKRGGWWYMVASAEEVIRARSQGWTVVVT